MSLVVPLEDIIDNKGLLSTASHWERIPLGDVTKILNGFPLKSTSFSKENGFPVIRIRDLKFNKIQTYYSGDFPKEFIVDTGDLLIGMDGDFICYEWGGGKAVLNQRVCKLIPDENFLLKKFLFYGINGYLSAIQKATSSVTVAHLSSLDVLRIPFPLPPLPEQHRIVAKLDALMERVERNKQRLDKIPTLLKRFRQSVLAAAVSGRLTEGWRRENIHLHSAIEDYNQIIENFSKKTVKNKSQKNLEEIEGNEIIMEIIPEGWTTCALSDIFKFIDYRGKTPSKSPAGIRLITAKNIKKGYVSNDPVEYVTDQTYRAWMTRGLPQKGDIFFVTEGHTMGFSALNNLNYKFAIGQRIITLQPIGKFYSELFFYFINSQAFQKLVELNSTGTAAIGIKGAKMKLLLIPFPSLQEQHEIVRRVNQLFAIADKIETRYVKAKAMLDRLPQSIFAKAFRGELVPQDPEDEPAGVLLERVRAEKYSAMKTGKKSISRR